MAVMRHGPIQAGLATGILLLVLGLLCWAFGSQVDIALGHLLHVRADSVTLRWVLHLTNLGGGAAMIPLALLVLAWLLLRRRFAQGLWLFATIAAGRISIELAKLGFARPRPPAADRLADVT